MAHRHPCYRHPRGVWIAACPDCTAWHRTARTAPAATSDVAPALDQPQAVPAGDTARTEVTAAA
jgi:hypothetical protein